MSLKQKILAGVTERDTVEVPELASDDFDGVVTIRPLTDGEHEKVEASLLAGQVMRGKAGAGRPTDMQLDVAKSSSGQREALRIAAAYGMSVDGEKWTTGEIAKLGPAAVKRIANAVLELTGGTNWEKQAMEDDAASFRDDAAGADDRAPAPDGDAARE